MPLSVVIRGIMALLLNEYYRETAWFRDDPVTAHYGSVVGLGGLGYGATVVNSDEPALSGLPPTNSSSFTVSDREGTVQAA